MSEKTALAVTGALYLRPLLYGLSEPSSTFDLKADIPANNSLKFSERAENIRCAFLSPIDYARHGGEYCIVPEIAVSSSHSTGTIQLFVNSDVRNIKSIAVDIRVTSEIILAKIILVEKFRNLSLKEGVLQFIPMVDDVRAMLSKADAALVVNSIPPNPTNGFVLDLVEEWNDMTDLPYVHGFWVTREGDLTISQVRQLQESKARGIQALEHISAEAARQSALESKAAVAYLTAFSYDLGETEKESISEFLRYCFFHGVIGDIPDLNFLESSEESEASR